MELKMTRETI